MTKVVESTPKSKMFFGLICLVVGFVAFFLGNLVTSGGKNYETTTGVVKDYYMKYSSEGNVMYSEIAQFEVNGRWYEAVSKSQTSTPRMVGSSVQIKYNPNNPNDSYIYKKIDDYIGLIVGAVFGVVGVILLVSGVKEYISGGTQIKKVDD